MGRPDLCDLRDSRVYDYEIMASKSVVSLCAPFEIRNLMKRMHCLPQDQGEEVEAAGRRLSCRNGGHSLWIHGKF